MNKCIVIIGDFTDFFDSLNHIYLKSRLCELLECDKLENDYYAVFKNITKYSVWNLTDLLELNSLEDTMQGRKILNSRDRVLSKEDFKKYAKRFITVPNVEKKKDCGIPQGAAISAVLANVYMMKVDEEIQRLVSEYDGLYMRYSDDFIIVLSEQKCKDLDNVIVEIREKIKLVKLTLQDEKTKCYRYENFRVLNCDGEKTAIDYLGFTFDGEKVVLRDKTISKYYYRLYRKLKTIERRNGYTPKGNRISCKNLYNKYSIKGAYLRDADGRVRGNFLTYVKRAQKIFGEQEPISNKTKRHLIKIRRKLDKIKNTKCKEI